jgi:hypothetical protein
VDDELDDELLELGAELDDDEPLGEEELDEEPDDESIGGMTTSPAALETRRHQQYIFDIAETVLA